MRRLFVALALPDAVKDRISRIQEGLDCARWIDPENLHLTLRFVGEVDRVVADDLEAALTVIRAPAVELDLNSLGHFESRGRPHALWVGVEADGALCHLRDRVEAAAKRAGLRPEGRKFHPHITIARLHGTSGAEVSAWIAHNSPFKLPPVPVREVTLFRSRLGRAGARYEAEAMYPLISSAFTVSAWDADDTLDDGEEPDWAHPDFDVSEWVGGTWASTISAQRG